MPSGFRFAVTMSRGATMRGRVEGVEAFCASVLALGERLGPVRVKVPQARDDGFLHLLLGSLDPAVRAALDFRHPSWDDPAVSAALDDGGAVRVGALEARAPFRYLRFRDPPYSEDDLTAWARRLAPLLAGGVDVYAYFRHEDEPTAPRYAERLLALVRGWMLGRNLTV